MRIAFLTPEYPTERVFAGGLASYLRRMGMALVEQGHEVEIFTLSHVDQCIYDASIRVHRVTAGQTILRKIQKARYICRYYGYAKVLVPAWKLFATLRKRHNMAPFHIVQASNYTACGIIAALWKKVPVVTRISSYEPLLRDAYQYPLSRRQLQIERAEILQSRWSSAVYAPSNILAETLSKKEGLKLSIIEPPFDLTKFNSNACLTQHLPIIGEYAIFFGSIGLLKGCDRLVRILPELLERNPDLNFIFVGQILWNENGEPFDQFIKRNLAKYHNRVLVLPEQRQSILFPLVRKARFVVLPSRIDNLPNTCMEAMALKRVVIGTYGASFDQLIQNGINGFLVSRDDDSDLCACMDSVWNMDQEEIQRIGANAFNSLVRLNPRNTTEQLTRFFEEVIAQHRSQLPSGKQEA